MTEEQRRRLRSMWEQPKADFSGVPTGHDGQEEQEDTMASDEEPARCPYRPADQEVPEHNRQGPPPDLILRPRIDHPALDFSRTMPWLMQFLSGSPYSPLRLEEEADLSNCGTDWRAAFGDLLHLENGLRMPDKDSARTKEGKGLWRTALVRESLGAETFWQRCLTDPSVGKRAVEEISKSHGWLDDEDEDDDEEFDDEDEEEDGDCDDDDDEDYDEDDDGDEMADEQVQEQMTELDWYERMLSADRGLSTGGLFKALFSDAFKQETQQSATTTSVATVNEDAKPGVMSTLTTTERITLPDGSIHTKVVLKKRFADGREENSETTHTTRGELQSKADRLKHMEEMLKQNEEELKQRVEKRERLELSKSGNPRPEVEKPKETKGSGWFWS